MTKELINFRELQAGDEFIYQEKTYLVGDVNENGGLCDCCPLLSKDEKVEKNAEQLYKNLQAQGIEVLFDDRSEQPGVKFMDADLIGIPLRITVSSRALQKGGLELKCRTAKDPSVVPIKEIITKVKTEIAALEDEIKAKVVEIPFEV